jgi:hypothetical protein
MGNPLFGFSSFSMARHFHGRLSWLTYALRF